MSFNPRSPRGGATSPLLPLPCRHLVSIHAPHEGERRLRTSYPSNRGSFNPRSPRGGATWDACHPLAGVDWFQSTLPTRGSDLCCRRRSVWRKVSIHAPHEGERRPREPLRALARAGFNPRSPRGGATDQIRRRYKAAESFNPRSPRGGATKLINDLADQICVSIHAPHEGERRYCNCRP